MKNTLSAVMAMILAAGALASCAKQEESNPTPAVSAASSPEAEQTVYKLGVIQLVEHDALDASYKGFIDALKAEGFEDGKNLKIDYHNAQGEQANCNTIASKLVNDRNDLILAIATPAAQAVANATQDIPILVTAVTDPADAKLVASNEAPGGNVSGTSDLTPIKEQIDLLHQLLPQAKKVGIIYNSSETNSQFQAKLAREAATALGIEAIDYTISSSNELQQVVESAIGKVDALYAPTDNMVAAGISTITMVATPAKLPVIAGEEALIPKGALATYGINYYNLGKQTGLQAAKILRGEAEPATMPIEYLSDLSLSINTTAAKACGITIPQELLDKATIVE